jgi:hypothetical protein
MTAIIDVTRSLTYLSEKPSSFEVVKAPWRDYLSGIRFVGQFAGLGNKNSATIVEHNTQVLHKSLLRYSYYHQTIKMAEQATQTLTESSHALRTGCAIKAKILAIPNGHKLDIPEPTRYLDIRLVVSGKILLAQDDESTKGKGIDLPKRAKWKALGLPWRQAERSISRGRLIPTKPLYKREQTLYCRSKTCVILHLSIPQSCLESF